MNKLFAIVTITLLSVCLYSININTVDYKAKFEQWITQYNKNYSPAERAYRQAIYEKNLKMIEVHNADPNQTYTMGENQFADLTHEEFVEIYLTIQPRKEQKIVFDNVYIPTKAANPFVDWSNLTKVGDQGNCKSSWAFATASEIESVYRIKNVGTKEDLSVQQLVDCDTIDKGCTNGSPDYGYYFVMKSGLVTASQYPYAGVKQACAYPTGPYKITKMDYVQYENLKQAISEQPVSVEVDASYWSFYSGGILTDCKHSINHAALAVGYYTDGTWIIKNSWGTSWGENGFIRLGAGDTCAVGQYARIARV